MIKVKSWNQYSGQWWETDFEFWVTKKAIGLFMYRRVRTRQERQQWFKLMSDAREYGFNHRMRRSKASLPDPWDDVAIQKHGMKSWKAVDNKAKKQWARQPIKKLLAPGYFVVED